MNKVYIILVNYNGYKDTIECLESLNKLNFKNHQIIIVDNNSSDDSAKKLASLVDAVIYDKSEAIIGGMKEKEDSHNNPVILIDAKENNGFASGNNIALQYALAKDDFEYVWLLNNDTAVEQDSLSELVKGLEKYQNIGAVGSKILYYDKPELLQNVGSVISENTFFKLCKPILDLTKDNIDNGQYDYDFEVNDIMGASLLVKREVLNKVGLMPEEYFLYGEETDWNFNIQKNGYKLMTIYKSRILHKKSRSTGGDLSPITLYYRTRNQFILYRRYMNSFKFILFASMYVFKKTVLLLRLNYASKKIVLNALIDGLMNQKYKK